MANNVWHILHLAQCGKSDATSTAKQTKGSVLITEGTEAGQEVHSKISSVPYHCKSDFHIIKNIYQTKTTNQTSNLGDFGNVSVYERNISWRESGNGNDGGARAGNAAAV
ncbi:hypothetical protein J6590_037770 [Homalodisca vitripennis]|nr:hypothetical protein J6590_037770 [Homalodisca vitripennis]